MEITWSVKIKGIEIDVEVMLDNISIESSGIGPYEFWGATGFDHGHDFVEDFDVIDLVVYSERHGEMVDPSPRMVEAVTAALKDDSFFADHVAEEMGV